MTCHTPPLQKVKKKGEMSLPSLGPFPLKKNVQFRAGMGPRLGNGISPCFFMGTNYKSIGKVCWARVHVSRNITSYDLSLHCSIMPMYPTTI